MGCEQLHFGVYWKKNLYSGEWASVYLTCWTPPELSFLSPVHELSPWHTGCGVWDSH